MKKMWKKICGWFEGQMINLIVLPFGIIEWIAQHILDGRKPS